jgi:DNA-directed RNA polymerase subunit L
MYSRFFKSNEQIRAEKELADHTQANFLREELTKTYDDDASFYELVHSLSDAEILRSHADHRVASLAPRKLSWAERLFVEK